jgi:EmrB/QacA subfamily drug resistance transporter
MTNIEADATIGRPGTTMAITAAAVFMVSLDQLVVISALPEIRERLQTDIAGLEWTVNAYTLTFAVLLLTASTLADRFGRKLFFSLGLGLFTAASALAAMATNIEVLLVARALQGCGAAVVLPLTLTLLSAAFPPQKRGAAIGAWGGVAGLAVAAGPLIGGFIVELASWQWIFWVNVPIGLVLLVLAQSWLTESRGRTRQLDVLGTVLVSTGMLGVVLAIIRGETAGWGSASTVAIGGCGLALMVAFVLWQQRAPAPMLPLRLFQSRAFSAVNALSLLMFLGMFGSIFLITQFLQTGLGNSPLSAGIKMLSWTGMVLFSAPLGGGLSDKIGGKPIVFAGLTMQTLGLLWLTFVVTVGVRYTLLVPAFVLNGFGMGLYFGGSGNLVMGSVGRDEEGIAAGANSALRELGGVLGVAILAAVFSHGGGSETPQIYVDSLKSALLIGSLTVGSGALVALLIPRRAGLTERTSAPVSDSPAGLANAKRTLV